MRYTLFLSDLHLDDHTPELVALFCQFLQQHAPQADAIYILGDLFEAWLGDDMQCASDKQVAAALAQAAQHTTLYFLPGNRDLILGKKFAQQAGLTRLATPSLIQVYDRPILIMHGDELCLDDVRHQRYRRVVTHPVTQWLFLHLPRWLRRNLGQRLRQRSQQHIPNDCAQIADVTPGAAENALNNTPATLLIHGHTHRPQCHSLQLANGQHGERIVLGAWHDQAHYLRINRDGSYALHPAKQ